MKKRLGYLFVGIFLGLSLAPASILAEEKTTETSISTVESQSTETSEKNNTEESTVVSETQTSTSTIESNEAEVDANEKVAKLSYSIFNETLGWQAGDDKGEASSFPNARIEAFKANLEGVETESGTVQYRSYVAKLGWQDYVGSNEVSGVAGERLEAVQLQLTDSLKDKYDLYYRVKVQNFGWLDWASNGAVAGTIDFSYEIESIQIQLVDKGAQAPGSTTRPSVQFKQPNVKYQSHVQSIGWQEAKSNGETSGTMGLSKRMEAMKIAVDNLPVPGGIEYRSHVQSFGWQEFVSNNEITGTTGLRKRMEAISIRLTGELSQHFDIYYRTHAKKFGWLDWASNGQNAGTSGFSYQLEAVEIQLVKKGTAFSGSQKRHFVEFKQPNVIYQSHVQSFGWQPPKANGQLGGTTGLGKRVEGFKVNIDNTPVPGGIEYRSHVQGIGWQNYVSNNQLSGTTGQSRRVEAFDIRLTGELANHFDVYYRTHTEYFGWLGWNANGGVSGSSGYAFRMEGFEIVIVKKTAKGPTVTNNYKKAPNDIGNYFLKAPGRIELKRKHYYTNPSLSRGNDIAAGTVINVKGRVLDKNGYPILLTSYGYVTGNKNIVAATNKIQRTYMDVPYYNQMSHGYPNGCEEFSLYMALQYLGATKGQNIHQVTNAVPKVPAWGNPHEGFNGDPRDSYGFHTIYPRAFTPYAKRYAPNSREISGMSTTKFKDELLKGNPLVVWGTYPYLAPPIIDGTYYGSLKVANLHVWLITGFEGNTFYIADPIYGKLTVNEGTVALSYSPNKMAVAIDK